MSTALWLILIVALAIAFSAMANANGFNILTTPEGKPRFVFLNGFFSSVSVGGEGPIAIWWGNLDKESSPGQQFVVMVVALLLAYIEFRVTGTVWVALIFLLIAAVIKPPKSKITKGFMYFDLGVIILAAFFTGFAGMRHESANIVNAWADNGAESMARYAKSLKDKTPSVSQATTQAQQAVATAVPQLQRLVTEKMFDVTPDGDFQKVGIPLGTKVIENITWDCPQRCILEVEHDGQRICETGDGQYVTYDPSGHLWHVGEYKNVTCSTNGTREHFYIAPGVNDISFPKNLVNVTTRFGTDATLGAVKIKVTAITLS